MLDGRRYFDTFPDEDAAQPKILVSHELLDALAALEKEFRQQIEQFRRDAALPEESAKNGGPDVPMSHAKP